MLSHDAGITSQEPVRRDCHHQYRHLEEEKKKSPDFGKSLWNLQSYSTDCCEESVSTVTAKVVHCALLYILLSGREVGRSSPRRSPQGNMGSQTLWRLRVGGKGRIKQHIPQKAIAPNYPLPTVLWFLTDTP